MKNPTTRLAFICALIISTALRSQDVIHFKDGNQKVVKVLEITPTELKYRTWGIPDGPLYTDLRTSIKMILFENGTKEFFDEEVKPVEAATMYTQKPNPELTKFGPKYSIGERLISNHEMHQLLLKTKDPEICRHIDLAKVQERNQYVGFAAIPFAVISGFFLLSSAQGSVSNRQGLSVAGVSAACAAFCLTTSIVIKSKRSNNEAAAVRLYQQKY